MLFTYTPEGADPDVWTFTPDKLMNAEAEAIEKATGMTFGEWADALERNSVTAIHALLWVMLKRGEPTLTYKQVEFSMSEVELEFELEDKIRIRDALREQLAAGRIEPEKRERALEVIDEFEADIQAAQPAASDEDDEAIEDPKASAGPSSVTSGGLHSLPSSASTPEISTA